MAFAKSRKLFFLSCLLGLLVFAAFENPACCVSGAGCVGNTGGGSAPPPPPPTWGYGAYGSDIPHRSNGIVSVQLRQSVRNWGADMVTHYHNALGAWNDELRRLTFYDIPLDSPVIPVVFIVRTDTLDEDLVDATVASLGYGFSSGCLSDNWATVRWAQAIFESGHLHHRFQKICVSGTDSAPNASNGSWNGIFNFRFLMFMHELGHVLSLPDLYTAADSCLMRDGIDMRYLCNTERGWIQQHFGSAGGF